MKKIVTLLLAAVLLAASASALSAQIESGSSLDPVVLKPSNGYSVEKQFSSSPSTGNIKSREWNLLDSSQTDSGLEANFTFDTDVSSSNTIRLTVSDGTTSDVDEATQVVHDVPNATIKSGSVQEGGTKGIKTGNTVTFSTSSVNNNFDQPSNSTNIVEYSWMLNGTEKSTDPSYTTKTFSTPGKRKVKLKVQDTAGYSYTTNPITIDVSQKQSQNPSGGGGLGALPQDRKDNKTSEKPEKASNSSGKENRGKPVKKVTAESRNGVAQVTVQKGEGTKNITVKVDPASDRVSVKQISITSDTSGEVTVSFRDIGRQKPEQVPEPAAPGSRVYSYQEINTSINDSEVKVAEVDFSVNRSWLEERNGSTDEVVMRRYNEGWQTLQTDYINSTEEVHNFEASSTGFSYYAVALEEQEKPVQENNTNTTDTPKEDRQQGTSNLPLMLGIASLLLIAVLAFYRERVAAMLGGSGKRRKLEAKLEEIEQEIEEGRLEEADRGEVLEKVERASSLIEQERFEEAEEIMGEAEKRLE